MSFREDSLDDGSDAELVGTKVPQDAEAARGEMSEAMQMLLMLGSRQWHGQTAPSGFGLDGEK